VCLLSFIAGVVSLRAFVVKNREFGEFKNICGENKVSLVSLGGFEVEIKQIW
jgi:hypothetical protein